MKSRIFIIMMTLLIFVFVYISTTTICNASRERKSPPSAKSKEMKTLYGFTTQRNFTDLIEYCNSRQYLTNAYNCQLILLARAYLNTNNFKDLNECLYRIEENYRKGDKNASPPDHPNQYDVSADVNLFRGDAFLRLGNYGKSVTELRKSAEITYQSPAYKRFGLKFCSE